MRATAWPGVVFARMGAKVSVSQRSSGVAPVRSGPVVPKRCLRSGTSRTMVMPSSADAMKEHTRAPASRAR